MTTINSTLIDLEYHRLLVEHSPDLLARHRPSGEYLYASPAWQSQLGYAPEDLVGRPLVDLVHESDRTQVEKCMKLALARRDAASVNYRVQHRNGNFIWLHSTFRSVDDPRMKGTGAILAFSKDVSKAKHIEAVLYILGRGSELLSSDDFFRPLVSHITLALQVPYAFVTETDPTNTRVRMLAFWKGIDFAKPLEYDLQDTPCNSVINEGKVCHYPFGVQAMFPNDQDLVDLNAQGYLGIPIRDSFGKYIGHLAILDDKPLHLDDMEMSILKIFAARAGVELERQRRD